MSKKGGKMDTISRTHSTTPPGSTLLDALLQIKQAHDDYQKIREEENTKRQAILADRDIAIAQIRAKRDVIKRALVESFELRKMGLQAQIEAMDKAIDGDNAEMLHVVLDAMITTIQSSPFRDIADMRDQLANKNFVLHLK